MEYREKPIRKLWESFSISEPDAGLVVLHSRGGSVQILVP